MKTKQKRNWLVLVAMLVTAVGMALPAKGAVINTALTKGINSLTELTSGGVLNGVANPSTTFSASSGQIYSSFVFAFTTPVYLSSLTYEVDVNNNGSFNDPVDFTQEFVLTPTPGFSPQFHVYRTVNNVLTEYDDPAILVDPGGVYTNYRGEAFLITNLVAPNGGNNEFTARYSFTAVGTNGSVTGSVAVTNVPEPTSAFLGLIGCTLLLRRRR